MLRIKFSDKYYIYIQIKKIYVMFADQIIKQNTCSMIFFFPWKLPVKEYEINLNKHLQHFNMNMVILRRKLYKTLQDKLQRLVQI